MILFPFIGKFQNPRTDIVRKWIGNRTALSNQLHRGLRIKALRDENARAHRHAAVTSVGAMSVDLAAVLNCFERGLRTTHQFWNRDREEGTINGTQPQGVDRDFVRIERGTQRKAHVDNEPHAKFAQLMVVVHEGHTADKKVIGDLGKIHGAILSQEHKRLSSEKL